MKVQIEHSSLVLFESELFRTTSTLLIDDDYLLLVDPNWLPREIEFIHQYIEPLKEGRRCYLLFTHSDYDHIIGYGKFKSFETIASQNFIQNPKQESILEEIRTFDDQYYIQRNYAIEYPKIEHTIAGKQALQLGADNYQFYQAVGHNSDGIITYNASKQILIVGDYLSNIEFPYIYESVAEYKNTLNTLETIIKTQPIQLLITGHGDATKERAEMQQRLQEARSYIQQLEDAVREECSFDTNVLFHRYKFPKIMAQFHTANMALMKRELEKDT